MGYEYRVRCVLTCTKLTSVTMGGNNTIIGDIMGYGDNYSVNAYAGAGKYTGTYGSVWTKVS